MMKNKIKTMNNKSTKGCTKINKLVPIVLMVLLPACIQNQSDVETAKEHRSAEENSQRIEMAEQAKMKVHQRRQDDNKSLLTIAPSPIMTYQKDLLVDQENYENVEDNAIKLVGQQPVSTFSIDVDTASYSNIRRMLNQGNLPNKRSVRVEELINYFSYDYKVNNVASNSEEISPAKVQVKKALNLMPETNDAFSVYTEVGPSPFNEDKQLLHIGIEGKAMAPMDRPAANLVFLIDVSGSMNQPNKIGLLKNALKMLSKQLSEKDKVAIVVYAGAAGTVLKPTAGDNTQAINDALAALTAGGSTNGGAGIEAAYALAKKSFIKDGINRVMLATDGDFNVGTTNQESLKELIIEQRKSGIALSILGLGTGNYNDALMQELAQNGNGNAYYIDNLNEARKVLVDELSSTLMIIAKDVKIQVEFNPQVVSEYRLIGYETRALKREDFNNDKVDAGDIGAGHTVTAIYELSLVGGNNQAVDPLRYGKKVSELTKSKTINTNAELAFLRLRYKPSDENKSQLIEKAILVADIETTLNKTSDNFKFSAAVAGFGQILRGGEYLSTIDYEQVIILAQQGKGEDKQGYRSEFINLVKLAEAISPKVP